MSRGKRQRRRKQVEERIDEASFNAVIDSCTVVELRHPRVVLSNPSRQRRIAHGSGRTVKDVRLVLQGIIDSKMPSMPYRTFYELKAEAYAWELRREVDHEVSEEMVRFAMATVYEAAEEDDPNWGPDEMVQIHLKSFIEDDGRPGVNVVIKRRP